MFSKYFLKNTVLTNFEIFIRAPVRPQVANVSAPKIIKKMSNKRKATVDIEELSPEELRARVIQLEAHVKQLKNIIAKYHGNETSDDAQTNNMRKKKKVFNFNRFKRRRIALKLLYLGWDYHGFSTQEDTMKTIEGELFKALTLTKIIESRQVSNYHRCGRTDKGVSAFSQVISLDVRTNLKEGDGIYEPEDYEETGDTNVKSNMEEIEYIQILNRVLPSEIRIISWAPVTKEFSARFSCLERTYKYYFPRASLNIQLMEEAAQKLIGEHDFRNFCKMDVGNGVVNFKRKIISISFKPLTNESEDSSYDMIEFKIVATAFLWHQIRCIVAVLFLIGQELETGDVISELLNVESNPCKPQYCMASELPLVLFDCQFEAVNWIENESAIVSLIKHLQTVWTSLNLKTVIVRDMLNHLSSSAKIDSDEIKSQSDKLVMGVKSNVYKKLLERNVCDSLETRISLCHKKNRTLDS